MNSQLREALLALDEMVDQATVDAGLDQTVALGIWASARSLEDAVRSAWSEAFTPGDEHTANDRFRPYWRAIHDAKNLTALAVAEHYAGADHG